MRIEEILDNAIRRTQDTTNPENISVVVSSYPAEVQSELKAMLEIISLARNLPLKSIPVPNQRRLYLQHSPVPSRWNVFGRYFKLIPTSVAAFILVTAGTALGAHASLPGDKLFAVKKSYESLQVKLATTPENRAKLQLEIAAQRFEEAQEVLATRNDDDSKKVALEELSEQTTVALQGIKESAVSISEKNPDLVVKAEEITKSQSNLVAKANSNVADTEVIQKSQDNKAALRDIKKIIAAANEESGATITPDDTITTNGQITQIKERSLKLGKNEFEINSDTEIINHTNGNIKFEDLSIGDNVKIQAKILDNQNIAISITIIEEAAKLKEAKPETKPKETPKEPRVEIRAPIRKPLPILIPIAPIEEPQPEVTLPPNPNDTFGGFIAEPPVDLSAE